jgi:PAS domain-containing protein
MTVLVLSANTGARAGKPQGIMMIDVQRLATTVLSTSSDAIIATNREGVIDFWNQGAERIFGHSRGIGAATGR